MGGGGVTQLTHGSLFAGIGGFDLGFERAGMKTIWQVEIDEYCRRVLARHFPDAERFNDVRECGAHNLKPVDVICGGFPCQDISYAGRGEGLAGARSGLWFEYLRIVCELRPRFVVVENVSALLDRGIGRVLGDLAESRYDAEWQCLPANAFGAPHIRDRVFILAERTFNPDSHGKRYQIPKEFPSRRGCRFQPLNQFGAMGSTVADTAGLGQQGQGMSINSGNQEANGEGKTSDALDVCFRSQWAVEPNVGRVADGIPARMDRLRSLGNAIVPQIAEWIGRRIVEASL
jgi:DNA (cytosine-5)-methyltransferase 1